MWKWKCKTIGFPSWAHSWLKFNILLHRYGWTRQQRRLGVRRPQYPSSVRDRAATRGHHGLRTAALRDSTSGLGDLGGHQGHRLVHSRETRPRVIVVANKSWNASGRSLNYPHLYYTNNSYIVIIAMYKKLKSSKSFIIILVRK